MDVGVNPFLSEIRHTFYSWRYRGVSLNGMSPKLVVAGCWTSPCLSVPEKSGANWSGQVAWKA